MVVPYAAFQPFSLSAFQPFSPSKVHGVSKPAGKVVGGEVPGTLLNWGSYSDRVWNLEAIECIMNVSDTDTCLVIRY